MAVVTEEQIIEALRPVEDPELHRSIVDLGMLRGVAIRDNGVVGVLIALTVPGCPLKAEIERRVSDAATELDGVAGTAFLVWAPNARRASVVGNFNGWDGRGHRMRKRVECGVFELFVPGVKPGEVYKYEIAGPHGEMLPLKADPFAFAAELPPSTASV